MDITALRGFPYNYSSLGMLMSARRNWYRSSDKFHINFDGGFSFIMHADPGMFCAHVWHHFSHITVQETCTGCEILISITSMASCPTPFGTRCVYDATHHCMSLAA